MSAMSDLTAQTQLVGGGLSTLPRVNLLPPEIVEQAQFRKVQMGLGAAVIVALAGVGLLYTSAGASVSSAQDALTAEQSTTSTLQSQVSKFADVTATYAKAAEAQAMLVQAMGTEVRYSRFLNDLSLSIPDGVWLTNVTYTQAASPAAGATTTGATGSAASTAGIGTVTFTGVAFEHNDVATWLDALSRQKGFDTPYLQSSAGALIGTRKTVNWSTSVVLTPEALSGRYLQTGS